MRGAGALLREHPQAWVYGISAACWAALILAPPPTAAAAFCLGGDRLAGLAFAIGPALARFEWLPALSHWLLMTGAMMLPMAAMAVRHVAFRSFAHRRLRSIAAFLLAYVAVWAAAGPLYLAAGVITHLAGGGVLSLVAALAIAVAWQGTRAKRRALRQCHWMVPLPPSGWRADQACFAFGLAHGRACFASCWALMLLPVMAGHGPVLMLTVGLVALGERRTLAAEPLRSPAMAWARLSALLPSVFPLRAR